MCKKCGTLWHSFAIDLWNEIKNRNPVIAWNNVFFSISLADSRSLVICRLSPSLSLSLQCVIQPTVPASILPSATRSHQRLENSIKSCTFSRSFACSFRFTSFAVLFYISRSSSVFFFRCVRFPVWVLDNFTILFFSILFFWFFLLSVCSQTA